MLWQNLTTFTIKSTPGNGNWRILSLSVSINLVSIQCYNYNAIGTVSIKLDVFSPNASIIFNGETPEVFPLKSGTR